MKLYNTYWLLLVLLLGGWNACSQLGLQPAKSFDDKLAYAYGANTAVREASTSALNAHTITSEDMKHIMALNKQARDLLDAARSIQVTDVQTAESRLLLATSVIAQLQTYLRERSK